ncbi:DUF6443 domain-containing protein [Maribacter caenipelagi]|uniref:DUF6443 domain-containing protein n=1 Tax=Maribacter caenipelagi TaxID=1447781 RepID=UPI001AAEE3A9|nr:DUF6443 domain-containing protein [Maribacter caenipelagi]
MSDSQVGVIYQLYKNGSNSPAIQTGSGGPLTWNYMEAATYRIGFKYSNGPCSTTEKFTGYVNVTEEVNQQISINGAPSGTVCPGTGYTLTASGGTGTYTWYNNNTGQSLGTGLSKTVYPTNPSIEYKVVGPTNCGSDDGYVTINVKPVATAPTVTTNITQRCQDDTAKTDFIANKSVTWTMPSSEGTISVISSTTCRVTWNPNFVGTANITATYDDGCGNPKSTNKPINIVETLKTYSISTSDPQNNNVCPGGTLSVKLSDSQVGVIYQLYKNGSNSPAIQTGSGGPLTWNNMEAATYRIGFKYSNGPCSTTEKFTGYVNVTEEVNQQISINGAPLGTVCPGTGYTLTASGGAGTYTWYNNNTGQILGTGLSKTVYPTNPSVEYKVVGPTNCGSDDGYVTINVKPVATAPNVTANITQRCQDNTSSTVFTADKNVSWGITEGAGEIYVIDSSKCRIDWNTDFFGTATITATYDDLCENPKVGSKAISVVETLRVFEISTDDPSNNVCEGETLSVLLANTQDNVSYELRKGYYSNNEPVQYGTIPQKNGSQLSWPSTGPGQYFIKASYINGPCANTTVNTGYIVVTQENNGAIDITGEPLSVVCPGTSFTLNASPGENFIWTDETNNITIPGYNSITVSPTETTTYRVTGNVNCGEVFNEVTIEVNATPEPILNPPTICQGEKALVSAGGVENAVYNWYDSSNNLLETNNTFETPILNNNTFYKVQAVSNDGCSSNLVTFQVTVTSQPTWYSDLEDGDGLGDPNDTLTQCDKPAGYVSDNSDLCPTISSSTNDCTFNIPSSDPSEHNYVYTRTYQKSATEMQTDSGVNQDNFDFFTADDGVIQNITFFDGLGRTFQQTAIDHSANSKKDIVTFMEYDDFGRMDKDWLPYVVVDENLATFRVEAETETNTYYQNEYLADFQNTINPFSEKQFEPSPLNRILKQAAPGNDWALNENGDDHAIEFAYEANKANEVRLFNVSFINDNTEQPELAEENFYEAGQLYKNITRDENHSGTTKNHTTEEFTDKQGRVVLKRTYADVPGETQARHDTYYVYDDYGNLTFVLPPKMEATDAGLSTLISNMDALGYQYTYDHRNRLVEKQIPGKDEEFIVYNKLDQPILTQDANLRENGEWLFTKYDAFGRVAYTGIATLGSLATVKTDVENSNAPLWVSQTGTSTVFGGVTDGVFYTSNTYPESNTEILTINYYDNYDARPTSFPTSINILDSNPTKTNTTNVKDLPTVSKVKVLENDDWITSLSYYDEKGRAVYSYSENSYLGTVDIMETALDFVGKPLKTRTEHRRDLDPAVSGDEVVVVTIDNFTYDHVGRLLSQTQCIGDATMGTTCESTGVSTVQNNLSLTGAISTLQIAGQSITVTEATLTDGAHLKIDPNGGGSGGEEELIVFNSYDELGQLQAKKVGGAPGTTYENTDGLQTVNYAYNVRGWLKNINNDIFDDNDLFNFTLRYNDPTVGDALYNGNISQTSWNTLNIDNNVKTYTYRYDELNRLLLASLNIDGTNLIGNYYVENASYDKNGNILSLQRNSDSYYRLIDVLQYQYAENSNQLLSVTDNASDSGYNDIQSTEGFFDGNKSGVDYNYDANGNMVSDKNKGMFVNDQDAITYNHLNLPVQIRVVGSPIYGNINYVYDATGVKLNKEVSGTSSGETEYAGNYIYKKLTNASSELQFFSHPEGYVSVENGVYKYVYEYKDYLGNTRLSYTDENNDNSITVSTDPMVTEIVKESNYYPFGLEHKGYNNVVNGTENNYQTFQGQELEEELGKNTLAYQWRDYDPAIGRFNKIDRFAEKYYSHSPYHFAANNPIMFVDIKGDSINVGKKYQAEFNKVLESTFGDKASNFSYTKSGNLVYNGSKKDFKGSENKIFKKLSGVIGEKTTTNIIFESSYTGTDKNGNSFTLDPSKSGGEVTALTVENTNLSENYVVIDPNHSANVGPIYEVNQGYYTHKANGTIPGPNDPPNFTINNNVTSNTAISTMHGIGHVIYGGKAQNNVISFDNMIRSVHKVPNGSGGFKSSPFNPRKVDETHNRTVIKGTGSLIK